MMNRLTELFPRYRYLTAADDMCDREHGIIAENATDVLMALDFGFLPDDIIYAFPEKEELEKILGKCRITADNIDIIRYINKLSVERFNGEIQKTGLVVLPDPYIGCNRGFSLDDIRKISVEVKRMPCISLRGAYMNGYTESLDDEGMGKYFHCCYQTAKQMSVMIPCAMPYIVFGNCFDRLNKLKDNGVSLDKTLKNAEIVAMQNETAFYSKLFII